MVGEVVVWLAIVSKPWLGGLGRVYDLNIHLNRGIIFQSTTLFPSRTVACLYLPFNQSLLAPID